MRSRTNDDVVMWRFELLWMLAFGLASFYDDPSRLPGPRRLARLLREALRRERPGAWAEAGRSKSGGGAKVEDTKSARRRVVRQNIRKPADQPPDADPRRLRGIACVAGDARFRESRKRINGGVAFRGQLVTRNPIRSFASPAGDEAFTSIMYSPEARPASGRSI